MAHTNAAAQLLGHLVAKALAISKKFPFCGVEMWRLVRSSPGRPGWRSSMV